MLYFGIFLCIFWLTQGWTVVNFLRNYKLTDKNRNQPRLNHYPKISVIVTARDEGEKIADCLKSLLNLAYPDFEIVAVNDRSRDKTGQIMDQLATEDKRIRVLHITELPEAWLGKVHAMHRGAQIADGEFLLFTDGDVIFAENALEQSVRYTLQHDLAQLTLIPKFIAGDIWENGLMTFFGLAFLISIRPQSVSSMTSQFYAGIGAFNLVKKSAYQHVDGHQAIRMEVVDDTRLGRLLKRKGFKTHLLLGDDLLSLKWHVGVKGMIKGIEKNAFASIDYSIPKLLLLTGVFVMLVFYPYLACLQESGLTRVSFAFSLLLMHGVFAYCRERLDPGGWKITWTLPVAAFFTLWAIWNSAIVTLRQGGVKWRDTFYSLDMLKKTHKKQPIDKQR